MYKTVRRGENSLQYKILAQQEEGLTSARTKSPSRAFSLKPLTVIILLVAGIIASAVLVPLLLTNDFFTLTGTFQKFSVSTLKRTHSGNHVVVIAKKPFGWNAPHPSATTKVPDTWQVHFSKAGIRATNSPSTDKPTSTTSTPSTVETTTKRTTPKPPETTPKEQTVASAGTEDALKVRASTPSAEGEKVFQTEGGRMSSTPAPGWFEPVQKWKLRPSGINAWVESKIANNLLYIFVLRCAIFLLVISLMFFTLVKAISKRRAVIEKEAAESKEDKARLLKPSAEDWAKSEEPLRPRP